MAPPAAYLSFYRALTLCCIALPFVQGITYTMKEETPVDSYIGNVSADSGLQNVVGEDEYTNLRYSILSGGSQLTSQLFKISATTGVLTVGNRIDREELCPYADTCTLNIEIAAQFQSLLRKFDVEVIIEDINDNSPKFLRQNVKLDLSESTSVNYPLSLDAATDLDGSKNFSVKNYSLVPEDVPFRVVHSVNAVGVPQLSLVVSQELDRETRSIYSLTIWAYDGGSPPRSGSVVVSVNLQDVNDNAPVFTSDVYAQNISESDPPGTAILSVSAADADEGDNARVVYFISSQQPTVEQQKFRVDPTNGVVSLAQQLKAGVHRILVEAQDQGNPPKPPTQAVVKVTVLDTTNNPPVLSLDLLSVSDFEPGFVPESAKVSTAVGYLAVTDPDTGANALVTCSSHDQHFELQSLNLDAYKVIISKTLDRENNTYFNVPLVCYDGGSPQLTTTVTFDVWVLDVNDNPPVFLENHYSASVAENNGPSDGLVQVAATDLDAGNNANITYRLGGFLDMFQVGAGNGMIKARRKLDYEQKSKYVFNVLAVDQGEQPLTATATVTINVLDINDERPQFSAPNYTMTVVEGQEPGMYVGNVSAFDPDTGIGGQVELAIVPQPGLALPFELSQSGVITSTVTLDREHKATYEFHVLATDRGIQPLTSSAVVTVVVLDVNDNAPTFIFSTDNATDFISIPVLDERVVSNVHAIDPDAGRNGTVTYAVVGGNATNLFRLEGNTGAVVTLLNLDEARLGVYQLVVRATDQGLTPRHTDTNVTLQVVRRSSPGHMLGSGSGADDGEGETYVVIVVCIVVFTAVVSVAVVVTMCVLRKVDRDRKLKYTAACCPDGPASLSDRDGGGGGGALNSSNDYHQQVPAVSSGMDNKNSHTGGSVSETGYDSHPLKGESGSLGLAPLGFPQQRTSNVRTSQLQLPLSHMHGGRKTPLQLDVVRRADDFHSTSSTETTTGDSGHGSDEDIANHSHDMRPLSPANTATNNPHHHHYHNLNHSHDRPLSPLTNNYQNPPPRPLRIGGGGGGNPACFGRPGSSSRPGSSTPDTSASSTRPIFVHGGQFRGSKPHTNSVRFSADVRDYEDSKARNGGGRGRYASNDSIGDDESDLNTTTSGSFSVPPDDLYADFGYHNVGGGKYLHNDMVV
ncbi:protocadherin beta-1-like [Littorina saxatilis]|uniref:protocadherin beta-1-like n=1 Tax=Littorina saxatilis TaxID=31220 RepID=UPI0038B4A209